MRYFLFGKPQAVEYVEETSSIQLDIKEIRKFVNNWLWDSTERNTIGQGWKAEYLDDCALMIKDYVIQLQKDKNE